MIQELSIENFRGFTSLALKGLKRVNLVVGHNNSGKTSLLEGLVLLCEPDRIGELSRLFRPAQGDPTTRYFKWLLRDGAGGAKGELRCQIGNLVNVVQLARPGGPGPSVPSDRIYGSDFVEMWANHDRRILRSRIVSVQQREPGTLVSLVGKAQRKAYGEETLQNLLASVDPRIKKVRVDPGEGDNGNQVIVDIGLSELLPVSQIGQGVYRLMGIMAETIADNPDVFLIDEIENGLHHSVQEIVWKGLAEAAEKLGVQIFATTHSDECLEAAHRAFSNRKNYDLAVIQLFRLPSGIEGRVLDGKHIKAAIAGDIDLR